MSESTPSPPPTAEPSRDEPDARVEAQSETDAARGDLLDAELEQVLDNETERMSGAMVPVSPPVRNAGLWRRLGNTRAGRRARALAESTSNEPVLARLDEIREQQYTQMAELDRHLDRVEAAGSPAAQRLDEIAAELRTRLGRLGDPSQPVLVLLDAQKTQIDELQRQLQTRLERVETRIEEVWAVEEQLSQTAELRERLEAVAAQQETAEQATAAIQRGVRGILALLLLTAVGLGAVAWGLFGR